MTRDAAAVGSGLARARAARPIVAGERIHVVGAAGAGASAAALLAQRAGGVASGCDPGGPSQYTPALEAAGIPLAWAHDPAHVTGPQRPHRLAVTKALTAVDPDHPELAAARAARIPLEPWQQVVADAASGRTLVAVAGTHGKSTTSGWLVHTLVAAGADPAAFVGALLPTSVTGGCARNGPLGLGPVRRGGRRVRRQLRPVPAGPGRADIRRVGPPGRVRRHCRRERCLRDVDPVRGSRPRRAPPMLIANVGDPNVAALVRRLVGYVAGHA